MAWKQVRNFDINKMGNKSGYCLQNVRLAYGIGAKYESAKADMEANKKAGTLHDISTIPNNCAVPVYCDTSSQYEHVIVYDRGTVYSDKRKVAGGLSAFKCFGWGETCNGVRIVEYVADTAKKANEQLADEVIAGKWGNGQERKDRLTQAGYDYNAVQGIVDQRLKGTTGSKTIDYAVRSGDTLSAIAAKYGTTWQKIAQDNNLANPNLIYPGQRLVIKL